MVNKIGPLTGPGPGKPPEPQPQLPEGSFLDILAQERARQAGLSPPAPPPVGTGGERAGGIRFSAHAQERLQSRSIVLTEGHQARLANAVARADEKGASQSLVLLDDMALVVSVKNRVVITAMDESQTRDGVFTNIDSAVIA